MLIRRILSQILDWMLAILMLAGAFRVTSPILDQYFTKFNSVLITFILYCIALLIISIPFFMNQQTIGKAFFGIKIESEENYKIGITLLLFREIGIKLLSLYMVCVPVLLGKKGIHEIMTNTKVVKIGK